MADSDPPKKTFDNTIEERTNDAAQRREESLHSLTGLDSKTKSLALDDLVPVAVDMIPVTIPLPCALYVVVGGRSVFFRGPGERLEPKRVVGLQEKKVEALYIRREFWNLFVETLESMELKDSSQEGRILHIRHLLVAYGQELERTRQEPGREYFAKLKQLCEKLVDLVGDDKGRAQTLVRRTLTPDTLFINHSVNVAIYCLVVGQKLKKRPSLLKELMFAGMVHDIGNLRVPKEVLEKPEAALKEEEWEEFKSHPTHGAELLQGVGAPMSAIAVALQHEERFDGKGYPSRLSGNRIHELARICAVCDVFDELTNGRDKTANLSPKEAGEKMQDMEGRFDPELVPFLPKSPDKLAKAS